jgi:hypothetical protein
MQRKKHSLTANVVLLIGSFMAASFAQAHYLWIEQDKARHAKLYFGEFQEGVREKTGGRLDDIKEPHAWRLDPQGKRQEIKVTRQSDHFDLGVANRTSSLIAEELAHEVKDWTQYGIGVVKPMFYARMEPLPTRSGSKPELVLDILPEAGARNVFTVYFRNAPLAKAKVMVYAPNLWMQEHRSDENGKVKIATPWPGLYVLEVIHMEKQPGEFQGKKFEAVRHRATLTFTTKVRANDK